MKKLAIISFLCAGLAFNVLAQTNKPETNSFGMQYGVNFNGTVSQAVQLSGWIKNGIEIRGSMGVTYLNNATNTVTADNYAGYNHSGQNVPGTITSVTSSSSLAMSPAISVVKHIPLKSNLDFFAGGSVTCGFTAPTSWTRSSNTTIADSVYSYSSTNTKNPLTINWGLSIVGGANYFFYKNLAIGADFGLGFSASNLNGTYQQQQIAVNYGNFNQSTDNYNTSVSYKVSTNKYTLSLAGNAGLHLTYYVQTLKSKKAAASKM